MNATADREPAHATLGSGGATSSGAASKSFARSLRAFAAGDYQTCLEAGSDAWTLNSTDPRVANHMASVHLRLGDWKSAESWSRRALANDIDYARAWTNLGVALLRQGHADAAEQIYLNGVKADSGDWKAVAGLAASRRALGRYAEAIDSYRRAIVIAPDQAELRYNLAITYGEAGRADEARQEFRRYLQLANGSDPKREAQVRSWLAR